MSWDLQYTGRALRDLRRLDRIVARRVTTAVRRYADTEQGDVLKLHGLEDQWRLRVGTGVFDLFSTVRDVR